jgi:serine/threonine-protein phosphatase 2B catalytic subunit
MDRLCDPLNDRQNTDVPPPPHRPLSHHLLFPSSNKPNWRLLKEHLAAEGKLDKSDAFLLIELAVSQFRRERNLLEVKDPVTVVGDIHG